MDASSFAHGGLQFSYARAAIGTQAELEQLAARAGCGRAPLPEEAYPRNFVAVAHAASGWALRLDAAGALRAWHAAQLADPAFAKPDGSGCDPTSFDWTYSCGQYGGEQAGPAAHASAVAAAGGPPLQLPLDKLRRRDAPILFGCVVPLYADELHDRGRTEAVVKLRVMPDCFLLLCRLFTRIDGLRVRLRDVRWYGDLPQGGGPRSRRLQLLRDVQVREADMGDLRALLRLPPLLFVTPMMLAAAGRAAAAAAAGGSPSGALPVWLAPDRPPQLAAAAVDEPMGAAAAAAGSAPSSSAAVAAPAEAGSGGAAPAAVELGLDIEADQVYAALAPAHCVVECLTVDGGAGAPPVGAADDGAPLAPALE